MFLWGGADPEVTYNLYLILKSIVRKIMPNSPNRQLVKLQRK